MNLAESQSGSYEERYAHILKPIKDLEKNWNIDITSSLDDYLDDLEHVTISFDGGHTTMNFAQAAMLLQSSTCVYSKKVEYLHSLVYKVLDLVTNKKKQGQKSSVDNDGNDDDANFNDDDDFLSLDDIPDGKNLYMKEDFEGWEKFELLPQMPLCLIPLEDDEKGDNPLLSKTGEVLASRNDFKMNTCYIHTSGTLLLDLSHLKLLEDSLKMIVPQTFKEDVVMDTEGRNVEEVSGQDDFPPEDDGGGDDIGFDVQNDQHDTVNRPEEHMDVGRDVFGGDDIQTNVVNVEKRSANKKPEIDPLKPLSLTEEPSKPALPLVKGKKCIQLCPGIEDEQSKKRKRTKTMMRKPLEPFREFFSKKIFTRRLSKKVASYNIIKQAENLYWNEFKRRQSLNKDMIKKRKENEPDEEVEEEKEAERVEVNDYVDNVDNNVDDYDDDFVDDNLFDAIDLATGNGDAIHTRNRTLSDDLEDCHVVNNYEDLVRKHVEEYMASAQDFAQITDLSKRVSEWEDKINPRLEEEDTHEPFDINKYGSSVLDRLNDGAHVRFHEIVLGKDAYQICRMFLSTLMLANTSNVKIIERGSLEQGMDKFELELLSTKRHFEELQEYLAPSKGSKS